MSDELCRMLDAFIEGRDRSLALAGRLEVAIDDAFPDDNECQDLVLALASYRPGGGDQLYNETTVAAKCAQIKRRIGGGLK